MENILSFPRQFRGPDARPEQTLRMLEASGCTAQDSLKFLRSIRGAIGQSTFCLGPYKFHRIELRGIPGEPFHMEPWIAIEEVSDRFSPMDESFVP